MYILTMCILLSGGGSYLISGLPGSLLPKVYQVSVGQWDYTHPLTLNWAQLMRDFLMKGVHSHRSLR